MSGQISTLYAEILRRIDEVRRKENRVSFVYGSLAALLCVLGFLFVAIVIEELAQFGVVGRTLLFIVATAGMVGAIAWYVVRPALRLFGILKSGTTATLAQNVGKHFPSIRDRLFDAIQIYEERANLQQRYSVDLIDASFTDLYKQIDPLDFRDAVDDFHVRKFRKIVTYTGCFVILMFIISPSSFLSSFDRIVHYNQSFAATLPVRFMIEPGNTEVVRGRNVPISIRTEGKKIQQLSLFSRQKGQVDFDVKALVRQNDVFSAEIEDIKLSTEYYVSAEDESSEKFTIHVIDRPLIRSLQLKLSPPAYTRIPSRALDENVGDIAVYPGTKIRFQLASSKELSAASIVFSGNTQLTLTASDLNAEGSCIVTSSKTYHISVSDKTGLTNIDPVEYTIKIIPDEYPTAEILSPAKNLDLTEEMRIDLLTRIKDDFGFSKLRLAYRLTQSKYEKPSEEFSFIDIPLQSNHASPAEIAYRWDLSPLHLVPEDAVAYYVEVFDNDNVSGPKSGKSEIYLLRLPSLEEVFKDVAQSHDQSLETMENVAKDMEQIKRDVDDLHRDMKKNREKMDWQQQKKAEEMMQRYEAMKNKLEEASKKMDEMTKQMEDNKLLSEKTVEKYQELQKLMDELKSPELQEALKKLQESMKQLSPEQMKQAMEQLKTSEEQYRKSLERTIELLKRIHIEQKVDELIKRAEELQKQQESLKQKSAQTQSSDKQKRDELADQQKDLQKQAEALEKETADLKKKMDEFPKEMPLEEMTKAQQQLEQSKVSQKMQQSSQQMQGGDMQGAQQGQEQSEQDLSDFAQQMKQVQKSLQDKQTKQIVNEMRKQLQNMLELSKREESLKEETKSLDPNSQRFRENAEEQSDVKNDLNNVSNRMGDLSKKTFAITPEMGKEIGNALQQMDKAMENMEGRNPGTSSEKQGEAMGSLNRAAMLMQSALSGMMQGGQGGTGMAGLMGMLGQMSATQQGINQGTQSAMGQGGQGQALTSQQQAEYGRLAGQQSAVQKTLDQLASEAKNTGDFSKLLGDLDKVAQDMQEVQSDLEQGNVNPETVKKQEHILSRLLDSQRSMRERDYEKRRKAETGTNVRRTSPGDLNLSTQEGKDKLRQELLKVLEGKYSKDYETLIKKYFEQLEKEEVNQ